MADSMKDRLEKITSDAKCRGLQERRDAEASREKQRTEIEVKGKLVAAFFERVILPVFDDFAANAPGIYDPLYAREPKEHEITRFAQQRRYTQSERIGRYMRTPTAVSRTNPLREAGRVGRKIGAGK